MKTREELIAIKEEIETMNRKLAELSEDELTEVTGGYSGLRKREDEVFRLFDVMNRGQVTIRTLNSEPTTNSTTQDN